MATSKSVETLNNKVDQLIAAFGAQKSDIEQLQSENERLKNELHMLKDRSNVEEEIKVSVDKENLNHRIDLLMKEVEKCLEMLEGNGR